MNLKANVARKQRLRNFLKNKLFLPPDTHTQVGDDNCSLYLKFGVLCFRDSPFCLTTDEFHFLFTCKRICLNIAYGVKKRNLIKKSQFECIQNEAGISAINFNHNQNVIY